METLEEKIKKLVSTTGEKEQVEILQEINHLILTKHMIQIDDNFCLYPIEVEAYYYKKGTFKDPYTHQNELQKKRFGQFYFHRKTADATGKFACARGGVDICLSMTDDYYLSVLIRGTRINSICSKPNIIAHYIIGDEYYDEGDDCSNDVQKTIKYLEKDIYLCKAKNDPRGKDILINTERVGLMPKKNLEPCLYKPFMEYKLRSLIEFGAKYPENNYPNKEKIAISYFEEVKEKEVDVKITMEMIKDVLGFKAQAVYDHFNKEESK